MLIFWWYTGASIYRFIAIPSSGPPPPLLPWVILLFATPTAAFSYALIRKVKLEFKWSALSVIGMIVVIYFLAVAIWEFFDPAIPKFDLFFTGVYDHTFYPIAFGLLALCDLKRMPQTFWAILLVHALIGLPPVLDAISVFLFNHSLWGGGYTTPANFLPWYFNVETKAQLSQLPLDVFMNKLIIALRELLGIMLLLQGMVFYYLYKSFDQKRLFSFQKRTWVIFLVLSIMLIFLGVVFPYRVPGSIIGIIGGVILVIAAYHFFSKRGKGKRQ